MAEYRFEIDREIKTCDDCPMSAFLSIESLYFCNLLEDLASKGERCPDCPLRQVPTPHGNLIDKNYLKNNVSYGGDPELGEFDMVMWDDIENAPTIIEASD